MLFDNLSEIIAVNNAATSNISINDIKPSIELAEQQLQNTVIGPTLYAEIHEAFIAAPKTLTPEQTDLLPYLRKIIAAQALLYYVPKAEASITASGVHRLESDTNKTAYQQQVIKLSRQLQLEVDLHTEALLQYLDANAPNYTSWTSSPAYTRYRSLIIQSGSQLQEAYHTAAPYQVYHALRHTLYDVEIQQLPAILGTSFLAELKAKIALPEPGLTAEENTLITYLRKYIAYAAIANGIAAQLLSWDQRGLTTYSSDGRSENSDDGKRGTITPQHVDHLVRETRAAAENWRQTLSFYLSENASTLVFTTYYNWQQSLIVEPTTTPPITPSVEGIFSL